MQQFFDELFFALLSLALVINGCYLCFKLIVYTLEVKQFANFAKAISWRPSHPTVWGVAVSIGTIGLLLRYLLSNNNQIEHWLAELLIDLAPEMVGMTLAVAIIDELNQKRIEQQRKQALLEQLYSRVPDAAVEALRIIRRENE